MQLAFKVALVVGNPPANAETNEGSIPGSGRSHEGQHGNSPVLLLAESHRQIGLTSFGS